MHFFLVLLAVALSALAAARPLPPFSKAALDARAPPSTPANYTLDSDLVAALTQLKAVYDSLNEPKPSGTVKIKRDFWTWFKAALKEDGLLKARSSVSTSTPDDDTLSSDSITALNKSKAVYDSLNEKRMESGLIAKRDFWQWVKDMFKAPGLKARSSVSTSTSNGDTIDSDPVTVLTQLKAVYDSRNEKRMESGLIAKRDFLQWLKDMFEAPGLKARSSDDHLLSSSNPDDAFETERTCVRLSGSKRPILPRGDSENQGEVLARGCDP